jgi:hypothetical protein
MKLLVLNTIGVTGVEIFQAYLAEFEEVMVLPGQNFTMQGQNLYRPHDYNDSSSKEVFSSLNRHLRTKSGRVWMGLTKFMTEAEINTYCRDQHENEFVKLLGDRRQFFECVESYCASYFNLYGPPESLNNKWLAFYSCNIVLNLSYYKDSKPARIININNKIDFWLASISQTRTWNCIEACKFWIVNNLYLMFFQKERQEFRSFFLEDLLDDPKMEMEKICSFLGIGTSLTNWATPGLISPNLSIINNTRTNATLLKEIYQDVPLFKLADSIDTWGLRFLNIPQVPRLLERFSDFWNTTSHTNFDWVGPIAEEIVDLALLHEGSNPCNSLNVSFYHKYANIHSDCHDQVSSQLNHFLGCEEKEIVLPYLPYFMKVSMSYLINISRNYAYHSHSYIPVRQSNIYLRLCTPDAKEKIAQFGLTETMLDVEMAIDAADAACSHLLEG